MLIARRLWSLLSLVVAAATLNLAGAQSKAPSASGYERLIPVLEPIGNQTVALGTMLELQLDVVGPTHGIVTFAAMPLPLPANSSLNAATGEFVFTPDESQVGDVNLTFIVSNGTGTDSEAVTITVTGAPSGGVTKLSGRLLDTNDFVLGIETPVVGARVSLLSCTPSCDVFSDSNGDFTLTGIPSGDQILDIDTNDPAVLPAPGFYAGFREMIELIDGVDNVLPQTVYLPRIDMSSLTTIDPSVDTPVINPGLGVTLTVLAGSATSPDGVTPFTGQLSISEVPAALAPAPLPDELSPSLLITIQPVGVTFDPPAPIIFPNTDGLADGNEVDIWSLDPATGEFFVACKGTVSGSDIVSNTGCGVIAADWHLFLSAALALLGLPASAIANPGEATEACSGSTVSVSSGNQRESHEAAAYRTANRTRSHTLVYNSLSADPQPILSSTATITQVSAVPDLSSFGLSVGGVDLGIEVFTDTSGFSESMDEPFVQTIQFDASALPTGRYPYTLRQTNHFGPSSVTGLASSRVIVQNEQSSPFGAGWTLAGLQRLFLDSSDGALITDGSGEALYFAPSGTIPGLVGYWPFDDGMDPTADTVGGNDGDVQNATFDSGDVAPCPGIGGSLNFPGSGGSQVVVAHAPELSFGAGQPMSISIWIKQSAPKSIVHYLGKRSGCGTMNYQLARDNIRKLHFVSSGGGHVSIGLEPTIGQWMNWIVTYDASQTLRQYINGSLVSTTPSYSLGGESTTTLKFAASGSCGNSFPGLMDEVQIYDRALTTLEVQILNCLAPGTPGLDFITPPGDFSSLVANPDGSYTRTLKDGTRICFDSSGRHTSTVDRNGNTTIFGYDPQGRVDSITDPTSTTTALQYVGGYLSSITDPANRTTLFQHDALGNLVKITDPDSSEREFAYDLRHRLINQTSKTDFQTTYDYDFAGRFSSSNWPDGSTRLLSPSEVVGLADVAAGEGTSANPLPVTRPTDVVAVFTDGNGNPTTFETDGFGAATKITDALMRMTTITRDADGNPTQIVAFDGAVTTMTHDGIGNVLTVTEEGTDGPGDPAGDDLATTFTYDDDPATTEYDPLFGQVTSITDPKGNPPTIINHDASGNPIEIIDALGTKTVLAYADPNCPGQVTSVTSAFGLPEESTVSFQYEPTTCNLTTVIDPLAHVTNFDYDAAGNVIKITDAETNSTEFQYDPMNRVTKVIDATATGTNPACGTAGATCLAYDDAGNLAAVVDANGGATIFTYDPIDRLSSRIDQVGALEFFFYDGNGNLVLSIDRKGQAISYQYDVVDRRTAKTLLPGDPAEEVVTYAYDLADNLTSVVDPDSALTFTYDAFGRLDSASTAGSPLQPSVVLDYAYDANGNRTSMMDPTGTTTYMYDELDRVTQIASPSGAVDFTYDALSRRKSASFPNGVVSTYTYDLASQLKTLSHDLGAMTISSFAYDYDNVGNRTSLTQTRAAVAVEPVLTYVYDELYRLTQATRPLPAMPVETFQYDAVGNRLLKDGQTLVAHFDDANRLLEDEDYCYDYDENGNLITKEAKVGGLCRAGGILTEYSYDVENRVVEVRIGGSSVERYAYDGLGRRIERLVASTTRRYVYDDEDITLVYDTTGTTLAAFEHGPSIDEPLLLAEAGQVYSLQVDALGSVVDVVSSTGVVTDFYVYQAFEVAQAVATLSSTYSFAGREQDGDTGLFYYRARHLDSAIGRFVQEDPLAGGLLVPGTLNPYPYVINNPLRFVDNAGLQAQERDLLNEFSNIDELDQAGRRVAQKLPFSDIGTSLAVGAFGCGIGIRFAGIQGCAVGFAIGGIGSFLFTATGLILLFPEPCP